MRIWTERNKSLKKKVWKLKSGCGFYYLDGVNLDKSEEGLLTYPFTRHVSILGSSFSREYEQERWWFQQSGYTHLLRVLKLNFDGSFFEGYASGRMGWSYKG